MVHYGRWERRTRQQEASLLSNLPPTPTQQPRFLDRFRTALQIRGRPPEVVEAFARWVRDFILFHGLRHPETMGEADSWPARSAAPPSATVAWGAKPRSCSSHRRTAQVSPSQASS